MSNYYDGGASSVYFWELDEETHFACCVLFKKEVETKKKGLDSGAWDAIHVVEVRPSGGKATYKLTSTIMLRLATDHSLGPSSSGELKLSGSMTRQAEQTYSCSDSNSHLSNMGRMIEEMENRMRDSLQDVYFGKSKSTVNKLYSAGGMQIEEQKKALANNLQAEMARRGGAKHIS